MTRVAMRWTRGPSLYAHARTGRDATPRPDKFSKSLRFPDQLVFDNRLDLSYLPIPGASSDKSCSSRNMAGPMKSCLFCSLNTGSYLVVIYTFVLSMMLLAFNTHDFVYARDFVAWTRIASFVFAVALFAAGVALLLGLNKNAKALMNFWLLVFGIYVLFQIAFVIWNIANYLNSYNPIPAEIQASVQTNMILFGILIIVNILCLLAIQSRSYEV
ncbi:hypothetical protein BV898_15716 [Hypsibius exemplaris]|uniref:Uncharacterized protein n=1 Tax=Hypsibius exemplaris TaxID=2072580 RepID=A0A9X6NBT9_HYPEX|nr:hypothetical protein BV898_15716 [Hypsibius exemplaris]